MTCDSSLSLWSLYETEFTLSLIWKDRVKDRSQVVQILTKRLNGADGGDGTVIRIGIQEVHVASVVRTSRLNCKISALPRNSL